MRSFWSSARCAVNDAALPCCPSLCRSVESMVSRAAAVLLALSAAATASTNDDDKVTSIPGFEA